jgi:hypothetical protein
MMMMMMCFYLVGSSPPSHPSLISLLRFFSGVFLLGLYFYLSVVYGSITTME